MQTQAIFTVMRNIELNEQFPGNHNVNFMKPHPTVQHNSRQLHDNLDDFFYAHMFEQQ